jgi:hypothetical protein
LDQKDLPVKSTEGPLIGIRKPIVPFYGYKDQQVARNLLTYRYNQLDKAIENAQNNLGFKNGAALYPMVTMNGRNATMNGNHMKKSIETERLLLLFLTIIALPVITLIFLKRTRSFNWYCTLLAPELISKDKKSI